MENSLLESFQCPICLELAEEAVETSCCHTIFCNNCLSTVRDQPCPKCRKGFEINVSHLGRRIIGNIPVQCTHEGCGVKTEKSELDVHQNNCSYRQFSCPGENCSYVGVRDDFATHLGTDHRDLLIQKLDKLFVVDHELQTEENIQDNRIESRTNGKGLTSRLGSSGKFYCGGLMNGPRCACCDGKCGPTNGCNCSACMLCDITARKLPKYWYVNREGASARKSSETGLFYCGRRVIENSRFCDGYCGPTNGPNCGACRILESQIPSRYKNIWH